MTERALAHGFCDRCGGEIAAGEEVKASVDLGVICLDCAKVQAS